MGRMPPMVCRYAPRIHSETTALILVRRPAEISPMAPRRVLLWTTATRATRITLAILSPDARKSGSPSRTTVERGDRLVQLGGNHADQPIIMETRQPAEDQGRPELTRRLVSLREAEQDQLALVDHEKTSLMSSVE
jgi:hypothetical protein